MTSRIRSIVTENRDTRLFNTGFTDLNGQWSQRVQYTADALYGYKTMVDYPTPQFRRRRNEGQIINSPMETYSYRLQSDFGTIRIRRIYDGYTYTHEGAQGTVRGEDPPPVAVSSLAADLKTLAATAARARVASSDAAGIVTYLERHETLALLKEPLDLLDRRTGSLERLIRKMKKAKAQRPEIIGAVSNWWLKYRYGILPLMSDIEGIMKALKAIDGKKRETARARESDSVTLSGSTSSTNPTWGNSDTRDWMETWEVSVRAGCLYEYESTLVSRLGLSAGYLPSALYDTVTLSFVLDWFVNVGDYIGALTADLRGDILSSWVTTEITCNRVSTLNSVWFQQSGQPAMEPLELPRGIQTSELLAWRTRAPVGMEALGVRTNVVMTPKRYADAFALIWGRLSGTLRSGSKPNVRI